MAVSIGAECAGTCGKSGLKCHSRDVVQQGLAIKAPLKRAHVAYLERFAKRLLRWAGARVFVPYGAHCSMKITAEVREYPGGMTDNEKADLEKQPAEDGMEEKSHEFMEKGAQIYMAEG